jgi:hypothetical protein
MKPTSHLTIHSRDAELFRKILSHTLKPNKFVATVGYLINEKVMTWDEQVIHIYALSMVRLERVDVASDAFYSLFFYLSN